MLIDRFLPTYDFNEVHSIEVDAPQSRVYEALLSADIGRSKTVRLLMGLRALPTRVWQGPRDREPMTLRSAASAGFVVLGERPPAEIALGIEGKFWKLKPDVCTTDASAFRVPIRIGTARAVWDFRVQPLGPNRSRLTTETRIACGDDESRRLFGTYWFFVRSGSGIIRRAILRQIAHAAEMQTRIA